MQKIRWIKKLFTVLLVLTVAANSAGCTSFFPDSETEIKKYESTSEEDKEQEEMVSIDWEDALGLAADYLKKRLGRFS